MNTIRYYLIGCCLFLFIAKNSFCQIAPDKPAIDFHAIDTWTVVTQAEISPDGNYTIHVIQNLPLGKQTFVVQSQVSAWKLQLVAEKTSEEKVRMTKFTSDSRFCIFTFGTDSIAIVELGAETVHYISHVNITALAREKSNSPYIIYENTDSARQVFLLNMETEEKTPLICVSYSLSPDGKYLQTQTVAEEKGQKAYILNWIDLMNKQTQQVWKGVEAHNVIFSNSGKRLAFSINESNSSETKNSASTAVFCFEKDRGMAKLVSRYPDLGFRKVELTYFSNDESMVFFKSRAERKQQSPDASKARVDVWNFNDPALKPKLPYSTDVVNCVNIAGGKVRMLTNSNERLLNSTLHKKDFSDEWVLAYSSENGDRNEDYWNRKALFKVILISTISGERKVLDSGIKYDRLCSYRISPDGKHVLYYDGNIKNYWSYFIAKATRINLTKNIAAEWEYAYMHVQPTQDHMFRGIAGWVGRGEDVLLHSSTDIWRVSMSGTHAPICVTNYFGKKYGLEFWMPKDMGLETVELVAENSKLILAALASNTKKNGFYEVIMSDHPGNPKELILNNYGYFVREVIGMTNQLMKADNADAWIIARQGFKESLNYLYTRDFVHFTNISNNYPERNYNWLTAELINFPLADGHVSQGILYKPENFDPHKKYPLIFSYYEELSQKLNLYLVPERSRGALDIPYYVSHGYLVFAPDIRRTVAGAGRDALNTMVAAGKFLSEFSYVNAKKMGLCGHSMGGYKTNFIVTHTNMFAAANASAGVTNLPYFTYSGTWGGTYTQWHTEMLQFYLGHSIDERPEMYVDASPLFSIKNVHTPLLMMANKEDNFSWVDNLCMFTAMRRAGKRAWLLQYDGNGHTVDDSISTTDFTVRQKQFFDHYLMDKSAPVWMTKGVPADRKQIDDGLELDKENKTPVPLLR